MVLAPSLVSAKVDNYTTMSKVEFSPSTGMDKQAYQYTHYCFRGAYGSAFARTADIQMSWIVRGEWSVQEF